MKKTSTIFNVPILKTDDIRAFAEFLDSSEDPPERSFHSLLKRHPALLGVLGYVQFLSEYSITKRDGSGDLTQYYDRPDILGARPSISDPNVLYIDIIELKATSKRISQKNNTQRLGSIASAAITQLYTYETELTTNKTIQQQLESLGLTIAKPKKILIFGRDVEFVGKPYDFEVITDQFRQQNIIHYTVDHILRLAEDMQNQQIGLIVADRVAPEHLGLLMIGDKNWKISINGKQQIEATEDIDLYPWRSRNPKMIFVPIGYQLEGFVMYCPACGSEDISSETYYERDSGRRIGDAADPCIVCQQCGAVDINPRFKRP